ncbi:MAG: 3,4-dihydroxy-2-butanone-4-phosphate synthase [Bdellovibrionaceae bacterium]|nr:3,4-dihydroxy-2-butanone-4-phosphate synthase [Pseudobdellovibrionaceae bacterium]MDW8189539.1 3,4-dihydroxy-2-butanone-4-phosphate synthase [Pseudobdellovibrionaceae bacterium]
MTGQNHLFSSVEELLEDLKQGKMIILVDDENRENEGDLVLPAQFVTSQAINFMAKEARGLICLALDGQQVQRLGLKPMVGFEENQAPNKTAFTVSIEASHGVTTGISAADRAHTIRVASDPQATPQSIRVPGHVFPIQARDGGVLKRAGHTEGSVDLMKLAGLWPASVICEIMNDDGSMARIPDLQVFAQKHQLKIGTIEDIIRYRLERETLVKEVEISQMVQAPHPWKLRVFESILDHRQHLVYQKGNPWETPLVRVQVDDFLKITYYACLGKPNPLERAFRQMENEKNALILILRGYEQSPTITARLLFDPFSMDYRDYGIGAQILRSCGITKFRLLSNNPEKEKRVGLKSFDLELMEVVRLD